MIRALDPRVTIFYVGFNDAWNRLLYSDFKTDYSHAQRSWQAPSYPRWRQSMLLDEIADRFGFPSPREPHIHSVAWQRKRGQPASNRVGSSAEASRRNLITLIAITRAPSSNKSPRRRAAIIADYLVENGLLGDR